MIENNQHRYTGMEMQDSLVALVGPQVGWGNLVAINAVFSEVGYLCGYTWPEDRYI